MFPSTSVKLQPSLAPTELFIVEGDSASLAVARVRDEASQAVLPMQGKPLNATRAPAAKVAAHAFYAALIDALGAGMGDSFDLARVRYERILLLMDPDADGIHCGVLLLGFFHRWMEPLLASGRILMVRPPWGEVTLEGEREPRYAQTELQFQGYCDDLRSRGVAFHTLRYRGLAGIHLPVLHATCVDPATRWTSVMTVQDAQMAALLFGK